MKEEDTQSVVFSTDHDLLITLHEQVKQIRVSQTNHLHHHWMITVAALSAGLAGFLSFAGALFLILVQQGILG